MKKGFELFKKAKKLLEDKNVVLNGSKKTIEGICYFFTVKDYNVMLLISKLNNTQTSIWKRRFTCDCRACIRGNQEMCSHVLAVLSYLVLNSNK